MVRLFKNIVSMCNFAQGPLLSRNFEKAIVMIQILQLLSLLLPLNGWGFWTYSDSAFRLFRNIINYLTIVPFMSIQILEAFNIILLLFTIIKIVFIQTLHKFLHFQTFTHMYLLLFPKLLFIPIIQVCIANLHSNTIYIQVIGSINLVTAILEIIMNIYFFRRISLVPHQQLTPAYQESQLIIILFEIMAIVLQYYKSLYFLCAISLNIIFILQFISNFLYFAYSAKLSQFQALFIGIGEILVLIVTFFILNDGSFIEEQEILPYFMIYGSLLAAIIKTVQERQNVKIFLKQFELKIAIPLITDFQQSKYRSFIMIIHKQQCLKCSANIDIVNCFLNRQSNISLDNTLYQIDLQMNKYNLYKSAYLNIIQQEQEFKLSGRFYIYISDLIRIKLQSLMRAAERKQANKEQIDLDQIFRLFNLQNTFIISFCSIVDAKIQVYKQLSNGSQTIYQVQNHLIEYGQLLRMIIQKTSNELDDKSGIVIEYRLLQINCILINDMVACHKLEQSISDILSIDRQQQKEEVNNTYLVMDRVIVIILSLCKYKGQIMNTDKKQINKHFGFDQHSDIKQINTFMPKFIKEHHSQYIDQYIKTKQESLFLNRYRNVFSMNKLGFIQQEQLNFINCFECRDDYQLVGCMSKVSEGTQMILFQPDGLIIGITQLLFEIITENKCPIQQYVNQAYIQFHMNQILALAENLKEDGLNNESGTLTTRSNIQHMIEVYRQASRINQSISLSRSHTSKKDLKLENKSLRTNNFQTNEILDQFGDYQNQEYYIQFRLSTQVLKTSFTYLQLEILDMKKSVNTCTSSLLMNPSNNQISKEDPQVSNEHIDLAPRLVINVQSIQINDDRMQYFLSSPYSEQPFSQRANFQTPMIVNLNDDISQIENQFDELNNQSDQLPDLSSNIVDRTSRQIIKYRTKDHKDINMADMDALKSKSSQTSTSSNSNSAIQTLRNFQQETNFITNLSRVLQLSLLILLGFIVIICINLFIVTNFYNNAVATNNNLQAPMIFNRYFFNLFALSFSMLSNHYNLDDSSQFIYQQTFVNIQKFQNSQGNLSLLYPIFINLEQSGLLTNITIKFLLKTAMNVDYTYFIDSLSIVLQNIYNVQNYNELGMYNFSNGVLTLRYNLKYVFQMNDILLQQLHVIAHDDNVSQVNNFRNYVFIQISIVSLIFIIQLYFFNMIEQYKQQLCLIICRIKQIHTTNGINQLLQLKQQLQQNTWKQVNFYKIAYEQSYESHGVNIDSSYSQSLVYSKIHKTEYSIYGRMAVQLFQLTCLLVYLIGSYLLLQSKVNDLSPIISAQVNYIRFASQMDALIASAVVVKNQPLLYSTLVSNKVYTQAYIDSIRDPLQSVFHIFIDLYEAYDENLQSIYDTIQLTSYINDADKAYLNQLYSGNLCQILNLMFCQNISSDAFNQRYGTPGQFDNNSNYLGSGIQGISSQLNTFFKQDFYYETKNIAYQPNTTITHQTLRSQIYINAILEHVFNTDIAIASFMTILITCVENAFSTILQHVNIYNGVAGFLLCLIYAVIQGYSIYDEHKKICNMKLSLSIVPLEVLLDSNTLYLIKNLA